MPRRAKDGAREVLPDLVRRGRPTKKDPREKLTQRVPSREGVEESKVES
jgi:hypothetical protein